MALTPWVLRLILANVAVFFVAPVYSELWYRLALDPAGVLSPALGNLHLYVRPWGLQHLLFNMLALFFFGPRLEMQLGGKSFLALYFLSGLGERPLLFHSSLWCPWSVLPGRSSACSWGSPISGPGSGSTSG